MARLATWLVAKWKAAVRGLSSSTATKAKKKTAEDQLEPPAKRSKTASRKCPYDYLVVVDFEATCDDLLAERKLDGPESEDSTTSSSTSISSTSSSSQEPPGSPLPCRQKKRHAPFDDGLFVHPHTQEIIEFPWVVVDAR